MRKVLYKILLVVNAFFAFALLISYLSVNINPDSFVFPAFFGLAYPYLLLINIILVIIWLFLLRFEALISIIIIAIGFTHFSNYIKLIKPAREKTNTFKVLSYNVRMFNYFENKNGTTSKKRYLNFSKPRNRIYSACRSFFFLVNLNRRKLKSILNLEEIIIFTLKY